MSNELRNKMGQSAVDAAKAVGYEGAGTVEFIVDSITNDYYFMEMNTRLQVEHPVSEMIMARDLVQLQLLVASGHKLPFEQDEIEANKRGGHSIEARIYAENPSKNFLPCTGKLDYMQVPESNANVRVETGVRQGDEVSIYYDPMIAKLVVWAPDRNQALELLDDKLSEYNVVGVPNNIQFVRACARHPEFIKGGVTTAFIDQYKNDVFPTSSNLPLPTEAYQIPLAFCISSVLLSEQENADYNNEDNNMDEYSPFHVLGNFKLNQANTRNVIVKRVYYENENENEVDIPITIEYNNDLNTSDDSCNNFIFTFPTSGQNNNQETTSITVDIANIYDTDISLYINNELYNAKVVYDEYDDNNRNVDVFIKKDNSMEFDQNISHVQFRLPLIEYGTSEVTGVGAVSPMAGKIVKILTKVGESVQAGDPLIIMEAMKMEHIIKASHNGIVESILYDEGDFVEGGEILAEVPINE